MTNFHVQHGHWVWDDTIRGLSFVSEEVVAQPKSVSKSVRMVKSYAGCMHADLNVTFCDTVNMLDKMRFRRFFQRRVKANELDVVTLRDIKDVVLFQTMSALPPEFIDLFHTREVDRILRALIVYFQMYIQIFDILVQRRGDAETKLHHPRVLEVENKYRSDLRMLRSMVGREYCILLLGSGNLFCFHHMANRQHTSAGERDTRLFELLYRLSARVVWIALRRRFSNLIEEELNRLFRTDVFNLMRRQIHRFSTAGLATSHENSILHGTGLDKAVLLGESPACLELLREKDYRMLGIGYVNFETKDPRMKFFEMLYDSPEEDLVHKGITIGILGLPRVDFDIMLAEKQTTMLHSSDVSLTTIASYLHSKVTVTSHAKKHPFTIPDLGEEEPVPDKFPCDNIPSSPDINLLERIDAKHIWKMNKTHPPMY